MSVYWDYIPKKDSELVAWSANFIAGVAANATAWGILPDEVTARKPAPTRSSIMCRQPIRRTSSNSPSRNVEKWFTSLSAGKTKKAKKALSAKLNARSCRKRHMFATCREVRSTYHRLCMGAWKASSICSIS